MTSPRLTRAICGSGRDHIWSTSRCSLNAERGRCWRVSGHTISRDDPPTLADAHPVLANRGDLLLAHFLLGHNIGGNITDRTRRILYYQLSCPGHQDQWEETFLDAFSEYAPIQAIAR